MIETNSEKKIKDNKRLDGRSLLDFRKINVETDVINKAQGSAHVRIGNTQVIVGVKLAIGEPYADSIGQGNLMCSAEFTPMSSPNFESGPPSPNSIELARVIDRGIRESKSINLENLSIDEKHVWTVFVDIHIISHDGNLMDAAALAAISALKTAKIPKIDKEKMQVIVGEYEGNIPIDHVPINVTVCKIGDKTILDPTSVEEELIDAKLSISVREDDKICALQKQGKEGILMEEIEKMIDLAISKSNEIRKMVN